jgi:hypothetical protein
VNLHDTHENPKQPGPQGGTALELAESSVHDQEHFLAHVVECRRFHAHPARGAPDEGEVLVVNVREVDWLCQHVRGRRIRKLHDRNGQCHV